MRHTLNALLLGSAALLAACAPPPQPVALAPAPPPAPRVVEVLPPAQPLAGVTLSGQPANPNAAFNGGGVMLEHRDGMTRQIQ